ncbi:methyltransferase domain-containing protein [Pseudomonas borbori]
MGLDVRELGPRDRSNSSDKNYSYEGRCMVCNGNMQYFFSKNFDSWGLTSLDYEKCDDCGFAVCATLLRMSDKDWETLNNRFHTEIYQGTEDPYNRAGRLAGQAAAIDIMLEHGLITQGLPLLDWGSGTGDLAAELLERERHMFSYDEYITPLVNRFSGIPQPESFSLVTAAAVFEHLKDRAELDAIERLVAPQGVLGVHLLIPREIPADPSWIYYCLCIVLFTIGKACADC